MNDATTERLDGSHRVNIERAAALLRQSQLIAIPTETVYGLAARSDDEDAIAKVYAVKGRDPGRALSVMAPNFEAASALWQEGPWLQGAEALAAQFWPGPLTIICPALAQVSQTLRGGTSGVGLRCPAHRVAQLILAEVGIPLVAPSANLSEHPSPTTAQAVADQLDGKIAAIVDGGRAAGGLESAIVAFDADGATLVRAGAIALDAINSALPPPWQIPVRHVHGPKSTCLLPTPANQPVSVDIFIQGSWRTYKEASVDALIQGLHTYLSTLSDGERGGAAWRAGDALRQDARFEGVCYLMDRYLRNR